MDLRVSDADRESIKEIEMLYSSFGMIVNDIYSYEKEVRAYNAKGMEGAEILNAVELQALDTGVSTTSAKRILWVLCRELELEFLDLVQAKKTEMDLVETEGNGEKNRDMKNYMRGLEGIMSGNEKWSAYTGRYHGSD